MLRLVIVVLLSSLLQGCFLTKAVTVPMRVTGAVVSVVPVVGNPVHDGLDTVAGLVDKAPL